ncbi:MAG: sec-independent protein translocase protein TatC [Sphingobacteriales bacterium]|jgi:sec-independent protein translocase protein TatC
MTDKTETTGPVEPVDIDAKEMSFIDHLESLRWHVIRSTLFILTITGLAFSYKNIVFDMIILGPKSVDFWTYRKLCALSEWLNLAQGLCVTEINFSLLNTEMAGQFTKHIVISFVIGLVLGFPYLLWEVWRFVKPGLKFKEKSTTRGVVFFSSSLFLTGVLFGYFIVTPMSINFLANYELSPEILNQISINSYISTITSICFAAGILFELPLVIYFLSKMGIITPKFMRMYRKHAIMIILILAAFLTPTPDIPTQLLISMPLFFLYEISIFISGSVERRKLKDIKKQREQN